MATPHPVLEADTSRPWSLPRRVTFRFTFCYLSLFCLGMAGVLRDFVVLFSTHHFPQGVLDPVWNRVVPWVGVHLLRLDAKVVSPTPFESPYDLVLLACQLALAVGASGLVANRPPADRISGSPRWLSPCRQPVARVRALLLRNRQGLSDAIRNPDALGSFRARGRSTPEGLLWTFMAGSTLYTIFCGAVEIVAGLLLLIPGCEAAGALVSVGATTNVFLLNLAYDVHVKLLSSHLLLCAVFLAACDGPRLAAALLSDKAVARRPRIPLSGRGWVRRSVAVALPAAGFAFLTLISVLEFRNYQARLAASAHPPLYGIWSVDEFRVTGSPDGPLLTPKVAAALHVRPGEDRWQQLIVDAPHGSGIRMRNSALELISATVDAGAGTATFTDPRDSAWKCYLRIESAGEGLLHLEGRINGIESSVLLHREPPETLRLLRRPRLHWPQPADEQF